MILLHLKLENHFFKPYEITRHLCFQAISWLEISKNNICWKNWESGCNWSKTWGAWLGDGKITQLRQTWKEYRSEMKEHSLSSTHLHPHSSGCKLHGNRDLCQSRCSMSVFFLLLLHSQPLETVSNCPDLGDSHLVTRKGQRIYSPTHTAYTEEVISQRKLNLSPQEGRNIFSGLKTII